MNYDSRIAFIPGESVEVEDRTLYNANVTQMAPDEALTLFGDAKQRPYVVRVPFSSDIRTGYIEVDALAFPLKITAANRLRQKTTFYGVEYHGRL